MGIKPIDLQTLFVKMAEVGKEQSLVKEQSALQQSQAARSQVSKELAEDRRVSETPEDNEAQVVKEDDSKETGEGLRDRTEGHDNSEDDDNREVVTDPDVGRHIDLSG